MLKTSHPQNKNSLQPYCPPIPSQNVFIRFEFYFFMRELGVVCKLFGKGVFVILKHEWFNSRNTCYMHHACHKHKHRHELNK
jgi:hypothetical protein